MRRPRLRFAPAHATTRAILKLETLEARWVPAVLHVGPGEQFPVPSRAAAVAQDGDDVQIDAGLYVGDVAVWRANNLTLEGVGGFAHLDAGGQSAQGKAIWVIQGNNTTVASIEFSGARVPDQNGAGIRQEGAGLTVNDCYFHDNEEGILTGANPASDITIAYSEFARNGHGDGYSHNMYIGNVRSFTLLGSYTHDAVVGHDVKSRANTNFIVYNRIQDGDTGTASYDIDLPNGGASFIIGNVIRKGPRAQNGTVVTSGEEGATNPVQEFYMVNNTVVNDRGAGTFVRVVGTVSQVELTNNLFAGRFAMQSTVLSGNTGRMITNLVAVDPGFVKAGKFNYHLTANSPAVDAGTSPGVTGDGVDLTPYNEYVNQARLRGRRLRGAIDIGAYEYLGHPHRPQAPAGARDLADADYSGTGRPDGRVPEFMTGGTDSVIGPRLPWFRLDALTAAFLGWPGHGRVTGGEDAAWIGRGAGPAASWPGEPVGIGWDWLAEAKS
jgi:hypothetical protein